VVRFSARGHPINSRPCNQCWNYLSHIEGVEIKTVYYFNAKGEFVSENFSDMKELHVSSGYKVIKRELDKSYVQCYRGH
jgi:hypothetical protein